MNQKRSVRSRRAPLLSFGRAMFQLLRPGASPTARPLVKGLLLASLVLLAPDGSLAEVATRETVQSEALNEAALSLYRDDDLEGAIHVWKKAARLAIRPDVGLTTNAEVLNNLGFAYYKLAERTGDRGHLETARMHLENALTVDPTRWVAYRNLGDLYLALSLPDLALHSYEKLLELNPTYTSAAEIEEHIRRLRQRQEAHWQTYRTAALGFRYPDGYTVADRGDIDLEVIPPSPREDCQPHCPVFLWIKTQRANAEESLETWLMRRWELDTFAVYATRPRHIQSHLDCFEALTLGSLNGYKVHEWANAVGITHYYAKQGSLLVELSSAETGLGCRDHTPDDWIRHRILRSLKLAPSTPTQHMLTIYGPDPQATTTFPRFEIPDPANATLREKLELLAQELSRRMFRNLPVVVDGIEGRNGSKIARIDLKEDHALQQESWRNSWSRGFFPGSAGGMTTTGTLVKTFLQEDYPGEWVDAVTFSYQGKPVDRDFFEHAGGLYGTHRRKAP